MAMRWLSLLLWCVALLVAPAASAHMPKLAAAIATIETNGAYTLELTFDLPPFALKVAPQSANDEAMRAWLNLPTNALSVSLQDSRTRFSLEYGVVADGVPGTVENLIYPTVEDVERYKESFPQLELPVMLMLAVEGHLPPGARSVAFRFPAIMGVVAVSLVRPGQVALSLVAEAGRAKEPVPIMVEGVAAAPVPVAKVVEPGPGRVARQFLKLGFEHIIPEGFDHILFVLGLFLLGNQLRPLLWQVTAFTVAHSITLGLALYGVVRLSPLIVEPLIALSIAFVAVENICKAELKPWRPFVVFGFGLMHGLGFAGVLKSIHLPRNEFATALIAFNGGVELGQLAVISLAFLAVGWWRQRVSYRRAIVIPASGLIAAIGLFWTCQRVALAFR